MGEWINERMSVSYEEILCVRWVELYGVVNIYTHCFWRGEADRRSWGYSVKRVK